MSVNYNPAGYRSAKWIMIGVALLIFLLFTGISGVTAWLKWQHSQSWTLTQATVDSHETLCQVERKSGKNWTNDRVLECAEAAEYVKQNDSFLTPYRFLQVPYATFSYETGGATYRQQKPVHLFREAAGPVGTTFPIMVDPADSDAIDEPWSDRDMESFWTMSLAGLGLGVAILLFGLLILAVLRRSAEKRMAAAAALAQAPVRAPSSVTAFGRNPVVTPSAAVPLWSRLLGWLGVVILVLGLLFALLAAIGGWSKGDNDAILGGAVVGGLGIVVWLILRFLAGLGRSRG